MEPIAHIESPYGEKFGIPRQSGMVCVSQRVVFEPQYRVSEAVRGLEQFSHIWLIWQFDRAERNSWSATVRPPRLGGNERVGVFATRSPFRPNAIGLSAVRLVGVRHDEALGPVLDIEGADMVDGTPIFDIKPYLPYADCIADATGGFAQQAADRHLQVSFAPQVQAILPPELVKPLTQALAADPRPRYHDDPQRVYGMAFGGYNILFSVEGEVATVSGAKKLK